LNVDADQDVHLMLVIASASDGRDAAGVIKTLVNNHRGLAVAAVKLHVFVATQLTRHIIQTLLNTWQLSQGPLNAYISLLLCLEWYRLNRSPLM